jgi:HTH-type transcriptional regulator/antitoxin HigA
MAFEHWRAVQSVVAFHNSETFRSSLGAVAAWLRRGELIASEIPCAKWNVVKFRTALQDMRKLTRTKHPSVFIPALQNLCAQCGVGVVILRAPQGCRASGATKFISKDKAMLLLSFRYRSDDHFWFTFFHEAGHLILHNCSALFIEGANFLSTDEEREADQFSEQLLVPSEFQEEMRELPTQFKKIMRFAKRIGVSPGIVVGQLQHAGVFGRDKMNFLKTRFVWAS